MSNIFSFRYSTLTHIITYSHRRVKKRQSFYLLTKHVLTRHCTIRILQSTIRYIHSLESFSYGIVYTAHYMNAAAAAAVTLYTAYALMKALRPCRAYVGQYLCILPACLCSCVSAHTLLKALLYGPTL